MARGIWDSVHSTAPQVRVRATGAPPCAGISWAAGGPGMGTPRSASMTRMAIAALSAALLLVVASLVTSATPAGAASPDTGVIGVVPSSAKANETAPLIVFGYATTTQAVKGVLTVQVPAGFTAPQTSSVLRPGFVAAVSICKQFKITGTAGGAVSIAVDCKARQAGALNYALAKAPAQGGSYPFTTT